MTNLINTSARGVLLATGLLTMVACAPEGQVGQFYREAGTQIDNGEFGRATLHNQLVQTCKTNGVGSGGKVGGLVGDPVVVLEPGSSLERPTYRVHCDGRLDGKYARVTYGEYIASATQAPNVREASAE